MVADGRVSAWLAAWLPLEILHEFHVKHPEDGMPPLLRAEFEEAKLYAALAMAPEDVGVGAGAALKAEYEQKRRAKDFFANVTLANTLADELAEEASD